jgi:hypothetical protein
MSTLPWHPLVVHFPLGLLASVPFLLTAARLARTPFDRALAGAASVNLAVGALAALLALATGLAALAALPPLGPALPNVVRHIGWSLGGSALFLLLAALRLAGRRSMPGPGAPSSLSPGSGLRCFCSRATTVGAMSTPSGSASRQRRSLQSCPRPVAVAPHR